MQSSDRIVLALVTSTCGVEAATALLTFAILSFNWCNTCCLSVRILRDERCKVTTSMKYAQAFRHSIFLRVHLLFWLRAPPPPPPLKMYFTVSKAFGAQANFNFISLFCKGELWSAGKEASVCPSEAGYICEAHLYYTGSPLPTCIPGGADHRQPLCPSTQQCGQPGGFYVAMFRWTLLPASFTLMSPAIDLAYVLPDIGGINSPEGLLGCVINNES